MKKLLGRMLAVIMLVMCNYLPIKINRKLAFLENLYIQDLDEIKQIYF